MLALIGPCVPACGVATRARATAARGRTRYHHGNLRAALIEAAERLIEEGGPESVTVREAARRAGVSSGAPFRHFPNRTALMTAVAEQGMTRLLAEVERALTRTAGADPVTRCAAFGEAYFRWVERNPTQFRVISARNLIDFEGSKTLRRDNEVLRAKCVAYEAEVAAFKERIRDLELQLKTWAAERDTCYRVSSALRGQLAFWRERAENKRLLPRLFSH